MIARENIYLNSPFFKIPMRRNGTPQILLKFLENINKTRRCLNPLRHRKRKPHCLTRAMIRILSDDNSLERIKRCRIQGIENQMLRWVYSYTPVTNLTFHKFTQILKIRLFQLPWQHLSPRVLHQQFL